MKRLHHLVFILGVFGALSPGNAQEADNSPGQEPVTASMLDSDEDINLWDASLRVDGWIAQLYIDVTDTRLGFNKSVFIGFDDILKNVDWLVPFGADLRYKRFGFLPDLVAMRLTGKAGDGKGILFTDANIDMKFATLNLAGYYRLIEKPNFSLDLVGGARYLWIDQKMTLRGGLLDGRDSEIVARIWDAIGGVRVQGDFNDKFFYSIYGDAGAGDSKLTWQAWGDLGYRLSDKTSVSLGYRYLTWEEKAGAATIDLTASGPIIVITKHF